MASAILSRQSAATDERLSFQPVGEPIMPKPISHCPSWVKTCHDDDPMALRNVASSIDEFAIRLRALKDLIYDMDTDSQIPGEHIIGICCLFGDYLDQLDDYTGAMFDHVTVQKKAPTRKGTKAVEESNLQAA